MTYAPDTLKAARTLILQHLPIDPLSVGIVGDDNHTQSGSSYHLGKTALIPDSYSIIESSRDRKGLTDAAAALDIGWFAITARSARHDLRSFSAWLVGRCRAGTTDTADIREVIYSLDGTTVKRWDRLAIRSTGDNSHLSHTHVSYFRDSEARDKAGLYRAYLTDIGLLEDGMDLNTPIGDPAYATRTIGTNILDEQHLRDYLVGDPKGGPLSKPAAGSPLDLLVKMAAGFPTLLAQLAAIRTGVDRDDVDEAAIAAQFVALLDYRKFADAVVAALPPHEAQQLLDALAARLAA